MPRDRNRKSLRERLAATRDPTEVAEILGKRRLLAYAAAFVALALGSAGYGMYMIVLVTSRARSVWSLLALPVFLFLVAFFGPLAYATFYFVATGQRWPGAHVVTRVLDRLNTNLTRG